MTDLKAWREAVVQSDLPLRPRCLVLALSVLFEERGYPAALSAFEIAGDLGASVSTAQLAIAEAVEAGWLIQRRPEPYRFGRGHKYEYEPGKGGVRRPFVSRESSAARPRLVRGSASMEEAA